MLRATVAALSGNSAGSHELHDIGDQVERHRECYRAGAGSISGVLNVSPTGARNLHSPILERPLVGKGSESINPAAFMTG
jgi:hypothetical protein